LLKFDKGDWLAGKDGTEIPAGTRLVAIMPSLLVGWIKWEDNHVVDEIMGLIAEGQPLPKRAALGDTDKALWACDDKGAQRDPWQLTNKLILVAADGDEQIYTFSTQSKGGRDAVAELCKAYGKRIRQVSDELPIIALESGSYLHSDRQIGRVKTPELEVVGWRKADHYLDLLNGDSKGDGAAELPFDREEPKEGAGGAPTRF
jgi:hypothetical protein